MKYCFPDGKSFLSSSEGGQRVKYMFVICLLGIIFENLLPKMSQWRSVLSKFYKVAMVERKCNKTEKFAVHDVLLHSEFCAPGFQRAVFK